MLRLASTLYAIRFCSLGYARLSGGLILQQRKGLRPREILALTREDLLFSADVGKKRGSTSLWANGRGPRSNEPKQYLYMSVRMQTCVCAQDS